MRTTIRITLIVALLLSGAVALFYGLLGLLSAGDDVSSMALSFLVLLWSGIAFGASILFANWGRLVPSVASDEPRAEEAGKEFNWLIRGTPEYADFHCRID